MPGQIFDGQIAPGAYLLASRSRKMGYWPVSSVQSPCILVCVIDPKTEYCFGCGRTRGEISGWMDFTNSQRDQIMTGLAARLETVVRPPRRQTRRRRMQDEREKSGGHK